MKRIYLKEPKRKILFIWGNKIIFIHNSKFELKLNIAGIIDRNKFRAGKPIKNVNTISSDQLDTIDKDSVIIIASTYFKSIKR